MFSENSRSFHSDEITTVNKSVSNMKVKTVVDEYYQYDIFRTIEY